MTLYVMLLDVKKTIETLNVILINFKFYRSKKYTTVIVLNKILELHVQKKQNKTKPTKYNISTLTYSTTHTQDIYM